MPINKESRHSHEDFRVTQGMLGYLLQIKRQYIIYYTSKLILNIIRLCIHLKIKRTLGKEL